MKASKKPAKPHGLGLWWFILLFATGVSITLNVWHAMTVKADPALIKEACAVSKTLCEQAAEVANRVAGVHPVLGIIFAIVPPVFAALLSHGLISPVVGDAIKKVILGLFGLSMLTSVVSQATVMRPYGGGYWAEWSIPLVLDASALIALHVITSTAAALRQAAEAADDEAAMAAVRDAVRPDVEAAVRAELKAELDAGRAELQAELISAKTELETELRRNREAELAAVRAEVEAELGAELQTELRARLGATEAEFRRRAEAEMDARVQRAEVETEARIRREFAEQAKQQTGRKELPAAPKKPRDDGLTSKDRAKILLAEKPDMTGADLGRALGMTPRYGRDLLKEIQDEAADAASPPALRAVL